MTVQRVREGCLRLAVRRVARYGAMRLRALGASPVRVGA
jgi:hypothetical protein